MGKFIPSKYNLRIFEEFDDTLNNIIISATAGSGKTSTLIQILKKIPINKDAIFLAFNKSVAEELRTKVPSNIQVSTIHSFGCRAMFKHFPGIAINENKFFVNALRLFKIKWQNETKEKKYYYCYRVSRLVELMMLTLTLETDKIEELANEYDVMILGDEINHALELFDKVYNDTNSMSFTDMIFQPAIRKLKLQKFDYVLLDELQDQNNCQSALIKKIIKPGIGRLIAVGDPNQSIYGFAGANFESFKNMTTMLPNTVVLPLDICYRCPKDIIKLARVLVPSITAAPNASKGVVRYDGKIEEINGIDCVICRNVKPLIQVFRILIKQGKKANIKGREIGENIITLINKTKGATIEQVIVKIKELEFDLRSKLFKKGYARPDEHPQLLKLIEKREIIIMLSEDYKTVKTLIDRIKEIFVDDGIKGITLSSVHRFKGLESDRIFFLNRFLIPSKYAMTEKDLIQENNILFVALTRSKKELIFIDII